MVAVAPLSYWRQRNVYIATSRARLGRIAITLIQLFVSVTDKKKFKIVFYVRNKKLKRFKAILL